MQMKIEMFFLSLTLKTARKLGKLAKFFLVVREPRKNVRKLPKRRSSEILKFSQENGKLVWWSANRNKICQVVRKSEKVENHCSRWTLERPANVNERRP